MKKFFFMIVLVSALCMLCAAGSAEGTLTLPASIKGIEEEAFQNNASITEVKIPEGCVFIGDRAFQNCLHLLKIYIPESVTTVGTDVFQNCGSVTVEGYEGSFIQQWCEENHIPFKSRLHSTPGLTYRVEEGKAIITGVAEGDIENLIIPETIDGYPVKEIGKDAFYTRSNITGCLILPEGLEVIGWGAFSGCSGLSGALQIPDTVNEISWMAFYGCSGLTGPLVIPSGVTNIGVWTFKDCSGFTGEVVLPDKITEIGDNAFEGCSGLTSVTIPDGVTSISNGAFSDCSSLTNIDIPDGVTSISNGTFQNCSNLTSITLPNSVKNIGEWAFSDCSSLTNIDIPDGVTSISNGAFYNCSNLTSITVTNGNTAYSSINGVLFNKAGTELIVFPGGKGGSYTVPSGVTSIGDYAFQNCSNLTSITLPNSVKNIGEWAFYNCSSLTNIDIPDGVTSIGGYSFHNCSSLTSITLPDSLMSVGDGAFADCSNLTGITLPNGVTNIGVVAFYNCSSLTSITLPDSLMSVGDWVFADCINLTSITLPDSVKNIGERAFYNCSSLTSVTILEGVTTIGANAFEDCCSLISLTIPSTVQKIESNALSGCTGLQDIYYSGTEEEWNAIEMGSNAIPQTNVTIHTAIIQIVDSGTWGQLSWTLDSAGLLVISGNGVMNDFGYNSTDAWLSNRGDIKKVVIGDGVTSIGSSAFADCSSLKSITLPEGVMSVSDNAFSGCSNLTSITLPNSVKNIGEWAFYNCSSLTNIDIPDGVTSIGSDAFWNCPAVFYAVIVSDGAKALGKAGYSFRDSQYPKISLCYDFSNGEISDFSVVGADSDIETATIPEGVTSIGDSAFYNCSSLTSITIPDTVTIIGDCAFWGCRGLTSITIPGTVTTLGDAAFAQCSKLVSALILEGVTSIGKSAFYNCNSLTSITIPNTVINIGGYAFYCCSNLTSITIPNGVMSIGDFAFYCCSNLTSITIPNGVMSIGDLAFSGCRILTSITIPHSVTSIGDDAFSGCSEDLVLTVEPDSAALQYAIDNQIPYAITEHESSPVEDFTFNQLSDGTYEVTGYTGTDTEIVIPGKAPDGGIVTRIGDSAFSYRSNLTSIIIPEGVTNIGWRAFMDCSCLMSITIPDSVTSIGTMAFSDCSNLTSITIPASVTNIAGSAFDCCSSLTNIYVDDENSTYSSIAGVLFNKIGTRLIIYPCGKANDSYTVPSGTIDIGGAAFYMCNSLTSITISEGVTDIGGDAFRGCSSLTYISIPEGVTYIGNGAFCFCSSLTSVTIPASVKRISGNPFVQCSDLTNIYVDDENPTYSSIAGVLFNKKSAELIAYPCGKADSYTVPSGTMSIGDEAFWGSSLTSITIPSSVTSIGIQSFEQCNNLTSIIISEGVTFIGSYAFSGCSSLTSITIPESVTSIDGGAFSGCSSLTSITIPEGVTSIGDYAFRNCSSLTSISLPSTLTTIGVGAFRYCSSLTDVGIWDLVELIADDAFADRNSSLTFHGFAGSYAETYANENGINFTTSAMQQIDYGASDATFTVYVYSPIQTKVTDAFIQVTALYSDVILKEAKTNSQGIATIEGLQKNRTYRFMCTDGHFTYSPVYHSTPETSAQIIFTAQSTDTDYLIASPEGQQLDQNGGTTNIQITSTSQWSAQSNAEWLTVSPTSGNPGGNITVTVSSNDGYFRTGEITISMGDQTISAYIWQPGALSSRLGTPTITYPAADNDEIEYGDIKVTWEAVEGAESYVVSLRDLDTGTLLIHHQSTSSETEATLSTYYFSDGTNYRVAVGAVPAGASSTDPSVGWCERLFTIPEFDDTSEVFFTGMVYELYSPVAVNAVMNTMIKTKSLKAAIATAQDSLQFREIYDVTVSVYEYNENDNTWNYGGSGHTNIEGEITIRHLEKGHKYSFVYEKEGYDFLCSMEMMTYTAQPGENKVIDVYCYNADIANEVEAMKKLKGFDVTGKNHGLFAEYFAWGSSNKNNIFTAPNKRNEAIVENIDFSWTSEIVGNNYSRLNAYSFASAGKGTVIQQVNYVPFKFGARFNGYIKLKGAADAESMANYQFRLRGDDGVRLNMVLNAPYEVYNKEDWDNGAFNKAIVDMSKYSFFNGTVFGLTIEYYNKSDGGKANLIFEYSIDGGKHWVTVPTDWLYYDAGGRTKSILSDSTINGVDYASQLAKSNATLSMYSDQMICNFLCSQMGKVVDSSINYWVTEHVTFNDIDETTSQKFTRFWTTRLGKKAAKSVYSAIFKEYCGLTDEESIWTAIKNQVMKDFSISFDTVTDAISGGINSIKTMRALNDALNTVPDTEKKRLLQEAILVNIESYTTGEYRDLDHTKESIEAGWSGFFDIEDSERTTVQENLLNMFSIPSEIKATMKLAMNGMKIVNRLQGVEGADAARATISLMYAELGNKLPTEMIIKSLYNNVETYEVYRTLMTLDEEPKDFGDRKNLEIALNGIHNKYLTAFAAASKGVSIEELLYKDLLKATLDCAQTYYKNMFK